MKKSLTILMICALVQGSVSGNAQELIPTVLFTKAMNPAFAEDYQAETIKTTVQFMAPGSTEGYLWGSIPKSAINGKVPFRVFAPGLSEPVGFGNIPPHVFIDKDKSDLVFTLKRGETIIMTGHPVVGKMIPGFTQIVFVADSISRVKPAKEGSRF